MRPISQNSTRISCAAARHLDAEQLLDGEAEGVLLVHRRDIVEPIEIGHVLEVGARLHQLLGAAMQQADMRIDALDDLAVEFEHEAQHAVRRRMLRAEIDREIADGVCSCHRAALRLLVARQGTRCRSPSQGDRKSKLRNSWVSRTGSLTTRFSMSFQRTSTKPVIGKSLRSGCPSKP